MESNSPILIFECANSHGGDFDILKSTIEKFKSINYPEKHIKFQAFHPDTISLPDFSAYALYHELLMDQSKWTELIDTASSVYRGIWLDIFDVYGLEIFKINKEKIYGVKLQASVLENYEVFSFLKENNCLEGKTLMLNVSGIELNHIRDILAVFAELNLKEIVLQIGHQAYPTQLKDTGVQKVGILKFFFPGLNICIADHADATSDYACIVPLIGLAAGCSLIEKHICLNRGKSKYDFYSAIEFDQMQLLADRIISSQDVLNGAFISESERSYLESSIQIPITKSILQKGSLISISDILFRRTSQTGVSWAKISKLQMGAYILNEDIKEKTTLATDQFKPAKIGVIVACRMKSSRLKNKALLPIDGISSIERCLNNCLEIDQASVVVLATSNEPEDRILQNSVIGGKVEFWEGDPDDVIQRYLGVCEKYNIDVIVRVTGDCPVISSDIASELLKHHFTSGADYTAAKFSAVGTACEIYNVEVLKRVLKYVGNARHSEYMTWYMQNNQDIFKVEIVELSTDLVRDYRLTLDYPEDLELFNELFKELRLRGLTPNIKNIFDVLDSKPEIVAINSHLTLMYKTDQVLIDKLNKETRITKAYT
jgi:N,N'-diacetyllegionaminate synthase